MAFVVEDGTGLDTATSYVSEAYADAYLGDDWAADSDAKQAALNAATEYVDTRWGHLLMSSPLVSTQTLEFPRLDLYNRYGIQLEGVPPDLERATCLYAKEYVAGTLYPVAPTGTAKDIKRKKTVVGPITTELEYQGAATASTFLKFTMADRFMRQYTYAAMGTMRN